MAKLIKTFDSYSDFTGHLSRARSRFLGRPLPGRWRLFKRGNNFEISLPAQPRYSYQQSPNVKGEVLNVSDYIPVFQVSPKGIVTFVLTENDFLRYSNIIVVILNRIIGITAQRFSKGHYRLGIAKREVTSWGSWCIQLSKENSHPYFKGMKFNISTGACLNPKQELVYKEVPERRKVWRHDLRQYKRGLLTRLKVGALDQHIKECFEALVEDNKLPWSERGKISTNWANPQELKYLAQCMEKNKYPEQILRGIILSCSIGWGNKPISPKQVATAIYKLFRTHSIQLREHYKVFSGTNPASTRRAHREALTRLS